jgi:hypothetical protein
VSKVGAWAGTPETMDEDPAFWNVPVFIRNGSELPVRVDTMDLAVQPWGYQRVLAAPEGAGEVDYYMDKRLADRHQVGFAPGTIAPGETRRMEYTCQPAHFDRPEPPMASVARVVVTDAAGYQWEVRPGRAGPARRVRQWRRRWWKHRGDL